MKFGQRKHQLAPWSAPPTTGQNAPIGSAASRWRRSAGTDGRRIIAAGADCARLRIEPYDWPEYIERGENSEVLSIDDAVFSLEGQVG